jgi:hypothetical protein
MASLAAATGAGGLAHRRRTVRRERRHRAAALH